MRPHLEDAPAAGRWADDAEPFAWAALISGAAIVYGLALGQVCAGVLRGAPPESGALLTPTAIALPYLVTWFQRSLRRSSRLPPRAIAAVAALQVVPFLLVEPDPAIVAPALLLLLQGHLLLHASDPRLAAASIVLGPLFVLAGMAIAPGRIWVVGFPVSVVSALVATLFLNLRENRRWFLRRARSGPTTAALVESWSRRPRAWRPGALRTGAYGVLVGALVLVLVPFLYLPLLLLPQPELTARAASAGEVDPEPTTRDTSTGRARTDAQRAFQQIFPGEVRLGGGVSPLVHEIVMEVTPVPREPGGRPANRGPLYLRGMVLDTVLERGVALAGATEPRLLADADDGTVDGWTELRPDPGGLDTFELDVRQQPIRVGDGSRCVLFGPRPLLAVSLPFVDHDPDGLLVRPDTAEDWINYRIRVAESPVVPGRADRSVDARFLQLPRASRDLERIGMLARDLARGAGDDRERVARVLAFFKREFRYSLETTDFPGLRGVVDFLDRRKGHCTYYATASMLLLRSLGVPARIATGFLASDWRDDHYVVTTANGHAWIEVAFEGAGWIPFDPTPAESRLAALAALDAGADGGLAALAGELYLDLERWISTGDERHMEDFAGALLRVPRALWTSVERSPWWWLALPLLSMLVYAWRRRREPTGAAAEAAPEARGPEADLYRRLLRALEGCGFPRAPAETPREFARLVAAAGPRELAPVVPWTERFYRARFGAEPMGEEERGALRRFVDTVRRTGPGEGPPGSAPGEGDAKARGAGEPDGC